MKPIEHRRGEIIVTTDRARFDLEMIHDFLPIRNSRVCAAGHSPPVTHMGFTPNSASRR